MKSILIATPAYGGQVTTAYLGSLVNTIVSLVNQRMAVSFSLITFDRESLISRARNKCAMECLTGGHDKLFFIDADIDWSFEQFKAIITSEKEIVGGTYPVKDYPILLNFNPLKDCKIDARDPAVFPQFANQFADSAGEIDVHHVPTGFMMIDRSVLEKLKPIAKPYYEHDVNTMERTDYLEFFPTGVVDGRFESEDWAFCSLARSQGYKIYLNRHAITGHTGIHRYAVRNP